MFAHLNPHRSYFGDIRALYSPLLHQLTMQSSLFEPRHLRPCPSYSRRRDRIHLVLLRRFYKGGGEAISDPLSPDRQGDRGNYRVPIRRTAQIPPPPARLEIPPPPQGGNPTKGGISRGGRVLSPKTQIMSEHSPCFALKMPDCCLNLLVLPRGRSSPRRWGVFRAVTGRLIYNWARCPRYAAPPPERLFGCSSVKVPGPAFEARAKQRVGPCAGVHQKGSDLRGSPRGG